MNLITDLHGLFSCARLEPMPDFAFQGQDEAPEKVECSVCVKQATREVRFMTPPFDVSLEIDQQRKFATIFICDECFYEDALWEKREIIKTTNI